MGRFYESLSITLIWQRIVDMVARIYNILLYEKAQMYPNTRFNISHYHHFFFLGFVFIFSVSSLFIFSLANYKGEYNNKYKGECKKTNQPKNSWMRFSKVTTQQPSRHITSEQRCYDVVLTFWRRYNVHTTSCAGWGQ